MSFIVEVGGLAARINNPLTNGADGVRIDGGPAARFNQIILECLLENNKTGRSITVTPIATEGTQIAK